MDTEPGQMSPRPDDAREELIEGQDDAREELIEGPDDAREKLIAFLESDQLVGERSRPLERRVLDRRVAVSLWALRIFVIIVGVMVIYTFFARLG